nr:extracellular solute-binding protein [Chloroflexota bacterium]
MKEPCPGAEYPAKISTLKAGNTLGDVMWSALGGALIQYHYGQKIIQPIDDLVKSQNVDLSGWYKGCLDAITIDGKLLGLPFKSHPGMAAVYYNQAALEAAGVAIPTKEWTIEQQLDMAKKLTKTEGDRVTQFGYLPNTSWKGFVTLLRAFGGELLSEDLKTFQLNSDQGRAATQVIWAWLLQPQFGLINYALSFLGVKGPDWFTSRTWVIPAIILISLWGSVGGGRMIIFLAALQG